MDKLRLAAAALPVLLHLWLGGSPLMAACQPPVLDHSYQTEDGTTVNVYRVPPGYGSGCMKSAEEWVANSNQGNSPGTASFEIVPTGVAALATCTVHIVDGTTMAMRGLPRITGGRFVFTNSQGRLVQLPLREVVSTDSGKLHPCQGCQRDAAGHFVPRPGIREAFASDHPCPATGGAGAVCPGYVIDYVTPLACGGEDSPDNLQWQTEGETKRKEAWLAKACPS